MSVLRAPLGEIERQRRPLRFGHVVVTIEDLLIVTWQISEIKLRVHLPPEIKPVIRDAHALLSAVVFRNRAIRPAVAGFPRIHSCQMNLRSYVLDVETAAPGSVFFHGLFVSRPWLARLSAWVFGIPFQYLPMTIAAEYDGDRVISCEVRASDGMIIRVHDADISIDESTLDLVTNPHTAYFLDRRDRLRTWSIWHRPQELQTMAVEQANGGKLAGFDLTTLPSALYVRSIDYEVYLPARELRP